MLQGRAPTRRYGTGDRCLTETVLCGGGGASGRLAGIQIGGVESVAPTRLAPGKTLGLGLVGVEGELGAVTHPNDVRLGPAGQQVHDGVGVVAGGQLL